MIAAMNPKDLSNVLWISIPLRDYLALPNDGAIEALSKFKNVRQIWFVAGDSLEDAPFVKQCKEEVLNRKMKRWWASRWKDSRHKDLPPKCHLEIIPALQARAMRIDGFNWL